MVKNFLNWALGLGFLGKLGTFLNGKKTILGIISLILASLNLAPQVFPECIACPEIAQGLQTALEWLGVVLTPVGVGHKLVKLVK